MREHHSRGLPPTDAKIPEFTRALMRKPASATRAGRRRARFGDEGFIQLASAIGDDRMRAMTVNPCKREAGPEAEGRKA